MIESSFTFAQQAADYRVPHFRKVDAAAKMPELPAGTVVRLLADAGFPPFSFEARSGVPAGLAVEIASAACTEIGITCEVVLKPLPELLPALAAGEGDVVISGPRIDEQAVSKALPTRAWFRSLGRFAVLSGSPLKADDPQGLAGARLGAIEGSAHAAWLSAQFGGAEIITFKTEAEAHEGLRTAAIDALFSDNLRLIYWVAGDSSKSCCKLLGGAYMDTAGFSRNAVFLVRDGRPELRDAFDVALDRLQTSAMTEKLIKAYVPLSPW